MPSYNVAAALLSVVGILGGAAYRVKPRAWILLLIGGLAIVNVVLTPYVVGKIAFGLGFAWIMWVLRRRHAVQASA